MSPCRRQMLGRGWTESLSADTETPMLQEHRAKEREAIPDEAGPRDVGGEKWVVDGGGGGGVEKQRNAGAGTSHPRAPNKGVGTQTAAM